MENKNQAGSSSLFSSFIDDLFGARDSFPNSVSNGIFSSIFPTPSTVVAEKHSTSMIIENEYKHRSGTLSLNARPQVGMIKDKELESNFSSRKEMDSIFRERSKPCSLSSSLYYGGQDDMYMKSPSPHTYGSYINYKKDGGVCDPSGNNSNVASRGNWWQGSLYY